MQSLKFRSTLVVLATLLCIVAVRAESKDSGNSACVPAEKNPERHEKFLKDKDEALKKGNIDLVFMGDSITDGWRNGAQKKLFDETWGKYNPLNIGISGDQTQHLLWRYDRGELDGYKARVGVLMIGTNNLGAKMSPELVSEGVTCVVRKIREKQPDMKLLLLAVFPRGEQPDNPFREQIKTVNEAIAKLDDGEHVKYLDIGAKFLDDKGVLAKEIMPDALHPNEKGYHIWADAIKDAVDEMMK